MPTRILVLTDDQALRALLADALSGAGYAATCRALARFPIAEVAQLQPDLILLDCSFEAWVRGADDHGMVLMQQVRGDEATTSIPFLIMSAVSQRLEELEASLQAKDITILYKPYTLAALLGRIRSNHGRPVAARAG